MAVQSDQWYIGELQAGCIKVVRRLLHGGSLGINTRCFCLSSGSDHYIAVSSFFNSTAIKLISGPLCSSSSWVYSSSSFLRHSFFPKKDHRKLYPSQLSKWLTNKQFWFGTSYCDQIWASQPLKVKTIRFHLGFIYKINPTASLSQTTSPRGITNFFFSVLGHVCIYPSTASLKGWSFPFCSLSCPLTSTCVCLQAAGCCML